MTTAEKIEIAAQFYANGSLLTASHLLKEAAEEAAQTHAKTKGTTYWVEGSLEGGTRPDGWAWSSDHRNQISRAWKVLPDGKTDLSVPEIECDGHDHADRLFYALEDIAAGEIA